VSVASKKRRAKDRAYPNKRTDPDAHAVACAMRVQEKPPLIFSGQVGSFTSTKFYTGGIDYAKLEKRALDQVRNHRDVIKSLLRHR
jgi:hypothetical protein